MYVWSWYLGTDHHSEYCRDALRRKTTSHDRRGLGLNDHKFQESNEDKRAGREKRRVGFGGGIFKRERRS